MRNLRRKPQRFSDFHQLARRIVNLLRVRAHVRGDHFAALFARLGRREQLLGINTRHIANAVGNAHAAAIERDGDPPGHFLALRLRGRAVFVRRARGFAEIRMPGEHRDVYRRAVAVDQIQIITWIAAVQPAVAAHGGRHAHAEHAMEDRFFFVGIDFAVRFHGVFVHVNVDKARTDDLAARVDHSIRFRHFARCARDLSIFNQKIQTAVDPVGRVDDSARMNQRFHFHHHLRFIILEKNAVEYRINA